MLDRAITRVIKAYVNTVRRSGIPVSSVFVFGSQARGDARVDSDIDIVVVVETSGKMSERELTSMLWRLRAKADSRIEPVLATREEWAADDCRIVLQAAKRDAIEVDIGIEGAASNVAV